MGKKADVDKKKKKKNAETKLKPKQQWDRYAEFKREPKVQVAIRVKEDESDEWLAVGRVKSKDSKYTAAAVFRQRAIIADVSLYLRTGVVFEKSVGLIDDHEHYDFHVYSSCL